MAKRKFQRNYDNNDKNDVNILIKTEMKRTKDFQLYAGSDKV